MGGLKRWVQAACRSGVKAIPCGRSCFGIMSGPKDEPHESTTVEGEEVYRGKLNSSFTTDPCKKCEEPIADDPSPLHCPAPAGHHDFSVNCVVHDSVINPMEVPEMELLDSESAMDENGDDWEALSDDKQSMMCDTELPMRSSMSWPPPKQRDFIKPTGQDDGRRQILSEQQWGWDSYVYEPTMAALNKGFNQPEPPQALDSLTLAARKDDHDNYDNDKENVKGRNGGGMAGWGGFIQQHPKRCGVVPKLMLTPGKGSSILSSYEPHSVRDNNAYESSDESWRSSGDRDGHDSVSGLQLALYKRSIGNSLVARLPGGVNSSGLCLPPCERDKESVSDGEGKLIGNVFHQLFQVEGVGINDQGLVWDRSSCESWDTDSRAKTTSSGRPSRSKSSCSMSMWRSSSMFSHHGSSAKSGCGKTRPTLQRRCSTWMDRSINWITCGQASFDRDIRNFVKHPREGIHRHANAARGAARYKRRQKILVNRIEVSLREGRSNHHE